MISVTPYTTQYIIFFLLVMYQFLFLYGVMIKQFKYISSRSSVWIFCAQLHVDFLFLHKHRRVCTRLLTSFSTCFGRGGGWLDMGGSFLSSVLYSQYQRWGREVCSDGHGGGESGCYRRAWSFSIPLCCIMRQLGEKCSLTLVDPKQDG
jgi:hypothetical protein